jgi:hypothetical protein
VHGFAAPGLIEHAMAFTMLSAVFLLRQLPPKVTPPDGVKGVLTALANLDMLLSCPVGLFSSQGGPASFLFNFLFVRNVLSLVRVASIGNTGVIFRILKRGFRSNNGLEGKHWMAMEFLLRADHVDYGVPYLTYVSQLSEETTYLSGV